MAATASIESATAAQTQDLPTIVLVQGPFQIQDGYSKSVQSLVDRGNPTIFPPLPSCSNTDRTKFPQVSPVDGALAICTELIGQLEYEGKDFVLVMHSYVGLVGSEAIAEYLTWAKRRAQGLPGRVVHLNLYAASLLNEVQSVLSASSVSP